MTIIPPEKRIRVMALETSCQKSCPHCFLDPGQGNFRQTERIALDANELGYEAHFYATAVSPRCDAIYKEIGQDSESTSICVGRSHCRAFAANEALQFPRRIAQLPLCADPA